MRTDDKRRLAMLEQARELAARGHYPLMIETVLRGSGFPEAAEWIDQPHIRKQLKDIADGARKEAVGLSMEDRDNPFGVGNEPTRFSIRERTPHRNEPLNRRRSARCHSPPCRALWRSLQTGCSLGATRIEAKIIAVIREAPKDRDRLDQLASMRASTAAR
jgi:hypothetical protein